MSGTNKDNPFSHFEFAPPHSQNSSACAGKKHKLSSPKSCAKRVRSRARKIPNETISSSRPEKTEHTLETKTTDGRLDLLLKLLRARDGMETPIDKFGTQACVVPGAQNIKIQRFQLLVAALLSSQTQDPVTYAAMQRLHQLGSGEDGLTVDVVQATSEEKLSEILKPVGFYNRKAQQLKRVAAVLSTQYDKDIPRSLNELLQFPGIGPKIGRLITLLAWNQVDGIIVDTHVHRLAQRLGWASTKTPEDTRKELEDWVPHEYWGRLSLAIVGFGQVICTAKKPSCSKCPLAANCPSAFKVEKLSSTSTAKR
ncbi:endonuclease iii-like protein 1-like [Plasmopara halstedii]|uniref:Endonuclease III homolog n=1 Tax=Plasmopara halstedii TaxID=4781 RepID=A0A0P1ADL2_PLAHL|nr:endonuclease iii-like protein 1-like [Plasmopara halstedii]CEG38695.1 endonuclease iii-like protein 1-like [Plasmopara halstedii]|eukprot:XP_024575064.1 endonuclease iii-like protein 1-like [Plasmopara halstedii]